MGVNAFSKPSPLLEYRPIPFKEIAYSGNKLRAASDSTNAGVRAIKGAQADVMAVDEASRNKILDGYDTRTQEIAEVAKHDTYKAKGMADQLGMDLKQELTRGQLATQTANKAASMANMARIDKMYTDNDISSEQADQYKGIALNNYKGAGELNEFGSYNKYKDYNPAFLKTSIPEQAMKVIKGWKPDTVIGDLIKTEHGFVTRIGKESVSNDEVFKYVASYLKQQGNNKAWVNQEADIALMGQDLTNGVQLQDRSMKESAWREQFTDDIYNRAASTAAAYAGYNKDIITDKVDWQKKWYMDDNAKKRALVDEEQKVRSDSHQVMGSPNISREKAIPKQYRDVDFGEDGEVVGSGGIVPTMRYSINKNSDEPVVGSVKLHEEAMRKYEIRKAEDKQRKMLSIYDDAKKYDIDVFTDKVDANNMRISKTPQAMNEEIQEAYFNYATEGKIVRTIDNEDVAIAAGKKLARSLDNLDIQIADSKSLHVEKRLTFEQVTMEAKGLVIGATDGQELELKEELKEVLRKEGVAGTTNEGKPYINYNGHSFIIEPTEEVKLYTAAYENLLDIRGKHKKGTYVDKKSGVSYAYYPDIRDSKFSNKVTMVLPGDTIAYDVTMEWLAQQTEKSLVAKNLLQTFKDTQSANYSSK